MKLQVLTTVVMNICVFWDTTPCILEYRYLGTNIQVTGYLYTNMCCIVPPCTCTWCGYKITGLMLEHLLFTKLQTEILSPSMYSSPRSLHRSIQIFHCWKQCCRSSSDSLFMSSVAFAFTASIESNLVPFNADLISGNIKVTWG